ncbi:MAG TPA: 30S ribosomal protein S6, partial [Dehalococcoidia bacterium]|nr:30S ribosomal protein S6 [Dehalococcoidia bacterium]
GEVTNVDRWGRRRLAYPIQRFTEGTYVVTELTLPAPSVAELDANLRISEDVIRHLIVRKDEK